MGLDRIRHLQHGRFHIFDRCCTRPVEPPDSESSVMFALPSDTIRGRFVQSETERRFILPNLSRHTVPFSQFIGNTVSVCIEDETTNSMKRFFREELDFGIGRQASSRL